MEDLDRPPSPVPSTPPRDRDEFCSLDLHQQLGHTKEVLRAVLNNSYPPVQSRHERFMKGGRERATLDKDASLKGVMTSREVSRLSKLLIRWVLRDLVKAEHMVEDCEVCASTFGIWLSDLPRIQVATEPDIAIEPVMATESEPPSEPPPSSLAGSVDLNRDSEVRQPAPFL